ncbi:MAG: hypothetical protein WAZ34_03005 [Rhodocyclaceae bacterium]
MSLEKAVNHNEHGEQRAASLKRDNGKTKTHIVLMNHPAGEQRRSAKPRLFVVPVAPLQGGFALSLWFELRFLG